VCSEYRVQRINEFPVATAAFDECVFVVEPTAYTVTEVEPLADTVAVRLPGIEALSNVVGRLVHRPDQSESWPILAIDADVIQLPPEAAVVVSDVLHVGLMMPVGTPVYRRIRGGKHWELTLHGQDPQAMVMLGTVLTAAYVKAGLALLQALGVADVTPAQVQAAVLALAAQGVNLDGFIGHEAEHLEVQRLAGQLPWLTIYGDMPPVGGA